MSVLNDWLGYTAQGLSDKQRQVLLRIASAGRLSFLGSSRVLCSSYYAALDTVEFLHDKQSTHRGTLRALVRRRFIERLPTYSRQEWAAYRITPAGHEALGDE